MYAFVIKTPQKQHAHKENHFKARGSGPNLVLLYDIVFLQYHIHMFGIKKSNVGGIRPTLNIDICGMQTYFRKR